MIDSDNEFNESPNHGTPYANMDSEARSIVSEYEVNANQIGQGSFGRVYKSTYRTKDGEIIEVAVKKIPIRNSEGFPLSAIREISILKKFHHPNIVTLIDNFVDKPRAPKKGNVSLVYEYSQHDLGALIKEKIEFDIDCIRSIMFQILNGIKFLHENYILHRDIKPANILINSKGEVKIADFGLSRFFEKRKNSWKAYTNNVETLWYRAPELLLSECYYKTSIDMWSVGCVMAELFIGEPLFKEQNILQQIKSIFKIIGAPDQLELARYLKINEDNADFINRYMPEKGEKGECCPFQENILSLDKSKLLTKYPEALDLLGKMLIFDVNKRISAKDALMHEFFRGVVGNNVNNYGGNGNEDPLYKKLQGDIFKNKEFHGDKIIYVKKNEGLIKEAKDNLGRNNYFCNELPKPKGKIIKKMEGYDLGEDKMDIEVPNQDDAGQHWDELNDLL